MLLSLRKPEFGHLGTENGYHPGRGPRCGPINGFALACVIQKFSFGYVHDKHLYFYVIIISLQMCENGM